MGDTLADGDLPWYMKPVAFLGSIFISYHEVYRGRHTATCIDCGRLSHPSADKCLCGGNLEENPHPTPDEYPEAYQTSKYDSLADLPYSTIYHGVSFLALIAVLLLVVSVPKSIRPLALGAILIWALADLLPNPSEVGNGKDDDA